MSCAFDWSTAEIVVRSYGDVAVYINPHGDIVLRQRRDIYDDEDPFVVIPLAHAERVAAAVLTNARESRADQAPELPLALPAPAKVGAAR
jgi:hypothetical protein